MVSFDNHRYVTMFEIVRQSPPNVISKKKNKPNDIQARTNANKSLVTHQNSQTKRVILTSYGAPKNILTKVVYHSVYKTMLKTTVAKTMKK